MSMPRVLFVCLGNICRSPTAHGVFRAVAARANVAVTVDSAGTGGWHVGNAPYGPAITAAAARGYDLSDLRARQFTAADFDKFDLIFAMDAQNLNDINALRPIGNVTPVARFLDLLPTPGDVPDPYYSGDFETPLNLIESASQALLDQLAQNASAVDPNSL